MAISSPSLGNDRLGPYELLRRLAIGGMGEIFLARQRGPAGFDRLVAVKRLLPELAERPELVEMFIDEARIAAHLAHPGIVHIHELGRDAGEYFLVMEYVPGQNLARLGDRAEREGVALPRPLAVHLVAEVARALDFAHEARDSQGAPLGVVHRDVSPHNVLVSIHGDVKLMDFGIAKARNKSHRTETGVVRGKLSYMSPEQLAGAAVDRRTDVFAAGVMLWELTLGRRLWEDADAATRLRAGAIPPPRAVDPDYPPELDAIAMAALEHEPSRRTATAGELAGALRAYLGGATADPREELGALVRRLFPQESAQAVEILSGTASAAVTHAVAGTAAVVAHAHTVASAPAVVAAPVAPQPRRRWLVPAAVIVAAAGGLTAFVASREQTRSPAAPVAAATPVDAGAAVADPPDAAPPPVVVAPAPDAAPPAVAKRPPPTKKTPPPSAPPDAGAPPPVITPPVVKGTLAIDAEPAGKIRVGGVDHGWTPNTLELDEGNHAVTVENAGARHETTARVVAGKKTKCRLTQGTLRCDPPR
jgi:hypothetical protein